jgi:hypothetical protein
VTKFFLLLQGIGFCLFGAFMFLNPQIMADTMGAANMSSDGIYELRGIYGGVSMGGGVLILAGALKPALARTALFFLLAFTGGYAIARFAALPLDGMPSSNFYPVIAYETITAFISAYLLKRAS